MSRLISIFPLVVLLGAACATPRSASPASEAAEQIRKVLPEGWSVSVSDDALTIARNERVANVGFQPVPTVYDSAKAARKYGKIERFTITLEFKELIEESELQRIKERRAWLYKELERLWIDQVHDHRDLKASGMSEPGASILTMNTYEPLRQGVERALDRIRLPFGHTSDRTVWVWVAPDIRMIAPHTVSSECADILNRIRSCFMAYENSGK